MNSEESSPPIEAMQQQEKGGSRFSWENIKKSFTEKTPEGGASWLDKAGRMRDMLLYDPRVVKGVELAFGAGMLGMLLSGNVPEDMTSIMSALMPVSNAMSGRLSAEATSSSGFKVGGGMMEAFGGGDYLSLTCDAVDLMPGMRSGPMVKAKESIAIFSNNMKTFVNEKADAFAQTDMIKGAVEAFGQKMPAQVSYS